MRKKIILFICSSFLIYSCSSEEYLFDPNAERIPMEIIGNVSFADGNLIQEAKDLHTKLQEITKKGIAFGQQEAIGGGVDFFNPNSLESDFSNVAEDYPAIVGFDLEGLELMNPLFPNPSIIDFRKEFIQKAHENGSIIAITWHASNPITKRNSFDRVRAVPEMLENGAHRKTFVQYLERLAFFFNSLKDSNGKPIPVLFRPWHEMNGDFFYWGEGLRTTEEFKQLYKDTFHILTNNFNVHNLLYVYSPNSVYSKSEYLKNYPGDDFVDLLGIDVYDFKKGKFLLNTLRNLQIVEEIATDKNRLFALTETGNENIPQNNWWTESFYKAIRASGISYAMVWRNATKSHFFVPYIGHSSEKNFKEFVDKDLILLNSDL